MSLRRLFPLDVGTLTGVLGPLDGLMRENWIPWCVPAGVKG
jgi:hypothetical protein